MKPTDAPPASVLIIDDGLLPDAFVQQIRERCRRTLVIAKNAELAPVVLEGGILGDPWDLVCFHGSTAPGKSAQTVGIRLRCFKVHARIYFTFARV